MARDIKEIQADIAALQGRISHELKRTRGELNPNLGNQWQKIEVPKNGKA